MLKYNLVVAKGAHSVLRNTYWSEKHIIATCFEISLKENSLPNTSIYVRTMNTVITHGKHEFCKNTHIFWCTVCDTGLSKVFLQKKISIRYKFGMKYVYCFHQNE